MTNENRLDGICVGCGRGSFLAAPAERRVITLTSSQRSAIAVRTSAGPATPQAFMGVFNQTLWKDLESSGHVRPWRQEHVSAANAAAARGFPAAAASASRAPGAPPPPKPISQGPWLTDWKRAAGEGGLPGLRLHGPRRATRSYCAPGSYNVLQADLANAQVFGKTYSGRWARRARARWPTISPPTS